MRLYSPPVLVSFLAPALALMLFFGAVARSLRVNPQGLKWFLVLALVSCGVLLAPVDGLPLARRLAGVVDHWSIPLIALLAASVVHQFFEVELLRRRDRLTAWIFGAVAGLALFPMALGWGPVDPFSLGWHFGPLFAAVALLTVIMLWKQNRFGVVLVFAILAWHLGVPESGNYWDSLVDPIYFLVSLGALAFQLVRVAAKKPQAAMSVEADRPRNP